MTVHGDDSTVPLFAAGRLGVEDPRLVVSGVTDRARELKTLVPGP